MSGLAALLAGRVAPGVLRWSSALDLEDVERSADLAGWRFAHVDGWLATTRHEVLDALGASLAFPDHYGRNLDALADCLSEVGQDGRATLVLWDGWSTLARDDRASFDAVLRVLGGRASDPRPPFAVLLRGDGPDLAEVPALD